MRYLNTFATLLAQCGGINSAAVSVAIATKKLYGNQVHWVIGDVSKVPLLQVDLVTMMVNVP